MHPPLADRIDNWARALRSVHTHGRAQSLEGAYRSPQPWNEPVYAFQGTLDLHDAYQVETAWASLHLPARIFLRGHHCLRWPPKQTCRVTSKLTGLAFHPRHFNRYLTAATSDLERALARSETQNRTLSRQWVRKILALADSTAYNASNNSTPRTSRVSGAPMRSEVVGGVPH